MEISTFSSEFVALGVPSEIIISLHYKLRMFSIPILVHADIFCDNESLYNNTAFSESKRKKKHNLICFHRVIECVSGGIIIVHKVHNWTYLRNHFLQKIVLGYVQ